MKKHKLIYLALAILILFISIGSAQETSDNSQTGIQKILQKYPAQNSAVLDQQSQEILQLGKEAILSICRLLVSPGEADDSQVRFALGGLTTYVNQTGKEEQRKLYAKAIIKALDSEVSEDVMAFLIRQLQRCGKKESVKSLKAYLSDPILFEPAVQALLTIGSFEAETMLLRSVDAVPQKNRASIIKALGELRSQRAVKKILKYSTTTDRELRNAALFALANIGDPRAEKVLSKFAITAGLYERAQAPSLYLLYARRLSEQGKKELSVTICRDLIQSHMSPQESHIACAALVTLADVLGNEVFMDLLAAMDSPSKEFRIQALELSDRIPGQEATTSWIERMENSRPEVRAEIIGMLEKRGDTSVLPLILSELKNEDPVVRLAAIPAAVSLGGHSVLNDLWPMLLSDSKEEIDALKLAFLRFPTQMIVPHAARIMNEVPSPARTALIEILAERQAKEYADAVFVQAKSEDETLREAALTALERLSREEDLPHLIGMLLEAAENRDVLLLQNAVVASANLIINKESRADLILSALETSEGNHHLDLLRILPRIGGERA
ncbi:MAG: HEAT repeat domain-containing protein, partial [Candidatus Aminicenantes bacterium]|nr:HEAT repeat domain-containing protein [Candidatus Aminicenantes bacterium]